MHRKLRVWSYVVNIIQEKVNLKNDSKSFVSVTKFRYLGTARTNQNYVREEINSRSKQRISATVWSSIFCLYVPPEIQT